MPELEQKIGPYPLLKPLLVEAAFKTRYLADDVDGVDLGNLHGELLKLNDISNNDEQKLIAANFVYAAENGSLFIPGIPQRGFKNGALIRMRGAPNSQTININGEPSKPAITLVAMAAGEGIPLPLSLYPMMIDQNDPMAILGMLHVINNSVGLMLRGENSPHWTRMKSIEKASEWSTKLEMAVSKFTNPEMTGDQRFGVRKRAVTALYNKIIETYDLNYFAGNIDSQMLSKQPVNAELYEY